MSGQKRTYYLELTPAPASLATTSGCRFHSWTCATRFPRPDGEALASTGERRLDTSPKPGFAPERRGAAEIVLLGAAQHQQEMDDADP